MKTDTFLIEFPGGDHTARRKVFLHQRGLFAVFDQADPQLSKTAFGVFQGDPQFLGFTDKGRRQLQGQFGLLPFKAIQ